MTDLVTTKAACLPSAERRKLMANHRRSGTAGELRPGISEGVQ
jgi:hypothetical protein